MAEICVITENNFHAVATDSLVVSTEVKLIQKDSRIYQLNLLDVPGTQVNDAWIFQWATQDLPSITGESGYAMIQQWMFNDETGWFPSANGIFTDVHGDYNWGHHVNVHDDADFGVGYVVGVHSPTGIGHMVAVDDNAAVGARFYAYPNEPSTSQNIMEFQANLSPINDTPIGDFKGDWMEGYLDDLSVFRVNYQGSAYFAGSDLAPVLTLGRGEEDVDYDFLKVDGQTSDMTMSWLEGERLLKINATSNLLGLVFGNPSDELFDVLGDLTSAGVNAAGFSSEEDAVFFLEAKVDTSGGAIFAGIQNSGSNVTNGKLLATFAGAGNLDDELPTAARISMIADGDWVTTPTASSPGKIVLSTQPSGGTDSLVTRMSIFNDGKVAIGSGTASSLLDVNGDVEIPSTGAYYLGEPGVDGSWRVIRSGGDLVFERKISGTWTPKSTITG